MMRIVIDTNVLIGSAYNSGSASRRIVEACQRGEIVSCASPATRREYRAILPRAVRDRQQLELLLELVDEMETVVPSHTPAVVAEDPDDDKFIAVAVCADADAIITNDRCVLQVDPQCGVRILRPSEFLNRHGLPVDDCDAT